MPEKFAEGADSIRRLVWPAQIEKSGGTAAQDTQRALRTRRSTFLNECWQRIAP
jgi:hypothetical protein